MDSCSKHASPRVMNVRLKETGFRWTVKAMIKAKLLPKVTHFNLHLRDRLMDVAHNTRLESMEILQGWKRVDQSKAPTVPRGIREGLLSKPLQDGERSTSTAAHSSQAAEAWARQTWGHDAPSNLTSRADIGAAVRQPAAMAFEGDHATEVDVGRVREATGITATASSISTLPSRVPSRH